MLQEVRQAAEVHRQASLGLLTVLCCSEAAMAAKPLQRSAVRHASSSALAALLCRSHSCQTDAADTKQEGVTSEICSCIGNALCRPVSRCVGQCCSTKTASGNLIAATPSSKDHALNHWQPWVVEPGTSRGLIPDGGLDQLKSSCAACAPQGSISMMWDMEPGISMIQQQQDCLHVWSSAVLQVWRCARQPLLCLLMAAGCSCLMCSTCRTAGEVLYEAERHQASP